MRCGQATQAKWILTAGALLALAAPATNDYQARALNRAAPSSPPEITGQPESATACVGNPVTFTVVAEGDPPLEYQWRKDGLPIITAHEASYTIEAVVPAHAGSYDVLVTNPGGSVTSDPATLTVINEGPGVLEHPESQDACAGDEVTFTVTPDGPGPFSYQWRKDGLPIIGAAESSYTIETVVAGHAGDYDVVVTNPCETISSEAATLTVVSAGPSITEHPQSQSVCEGQPVTFTVTATPPEALSYQWRKDGVEIPGATSDAYTIDPVDPNDAGSYDVVATNPCDSATSDPATLTVNVGPSISGHPQSQAVCEGSAVTFSVAASGSEPLSYQWRKDGVDIPGATGDVYTIDPLEPNDEGVYNVVVDNVCDTATSNPATLTVNLRPSISEHPRSQTVCEQAAVTFSVVASGFEPLSYQWRKDGQAIAGATEPSHPIDPLELDHAGQYDVVVSNACGTVTSDSAGLDVDPLPRITQQPQPAIIARGQSHLLCIAASGAGLTYQWRKDGEDIPYANADCHEASAGGAYACVVTNDCGSTTSGAAVLTIAPPVTVGASASPAAIKVGDASTLTAAAAAGLPPYTYEWETGQSGASIVVSPPESTVYTVTATDLLGQTASANVAVTVATPLTAAVHASAYTIAPGENSTLTALVWGGLRPFSYEWNTGQTGASITVSPNRSTTYTVTVTDPLGQTAEASATVAVEAPGKPPAEPPSDETEPEEPGQAEEEEKPPSDAGEPNEAVDDTDQSEAAPPGLAGLCPTTSLIAISLTLAGLWRTRGTRRRESRQKR